MPGRSWRDVAPCGTEAAYQRHRYAGQPADGACREAHTQAQAERRRRARAAEAGISAGQWNVMGYDEREDLMWSLRIRPRRQRDRAGKFARSPSACRKAHEREQDAAVSSAG